MNVERWSQRRSSGVAARWRDRLVVASAVLLLGVALAMSTTYAITLRRAPQPAVVTARHASLGTRVVVVGDSITYSSVDALVERFDERGFVVPIITGIPGVRSEDRLDEAPRLIGPMTPEVLVLELGTNDVHAFLEAHPHATQAERDLFGAVVVDNLARIARATEATGPELRCVVAVNVTANVFDVEAREAATAINRALAAWSAGDDRVQVADWDALLHGEFLRSEPNGPVTTDLIHPTPYGSARLAELVVDGIDRCPA